MAELIKLGVLDDGRNIVVLFPYWWLEYGQIHDPQNIQESSVRKWISTYYLEEKPNSYVCMQFPSRYIGSGPRKIEYRYPSVSLFEELEESFHSHRVYYPNTLSAYIRMNREEVIVLLDRALTTEIRGGRIRGKLNILSAIIYAKTCKVYSV